MLTKVCTSCQQDKALDQFHKHAARKSGVTERCKACKAAYYKKWRSSGGKQWETDYRKRRQEIYRRQEFRRGLRRFYNLTIEDYNARLKQQNGTCAACGKPETAKFTKTGVTKRLAVDHCHNTGRIRGLLCARCNRVLGLVADSSELLISLSAYLRKAENA